MLSQENAQCANSSKLDHFSTSQLSALALYA